MTYDDWKTTEPELDDEPRCDCTEPCDCAKPVGTRERRLKLWREYGAFNRVVPPPKPFIYEPRWKIDKYGDIVPDDGEPDDEPEGEPEDVPF